MFCLAQPSTCQWTSRTVYSVKITANTSWTLQKKSCLSFFFQGSTVFFQPQGISIFCVAALEVGTLVFAVAWWRWYEEWSNPPCLDDVVFFNSRRRGAKNAIGFQRKVVSSANWKQAFDWIWTDWDRLGYFMEIFGCLGLCLFALYRYLSSGFDFPPRLCCDTEEAESYATPARSPFVGFRCDLGNCTSGMVPS